MVEVVGAGRVLVVAVWFELEVEVEVGAVVVDPVAALDALVGAACVVTAGRAD